MNFADPDYLDVRLNVWSYFKLIIGLVQKFEDFANFKAIKFVQAFRDCSSVSSLPSSKVPRRQLHVTLRSFRPPASPFGQPSQTEYSAVSSQHIWHPSFVSGRLTVWNSLPDRYVIWPSSLNALDGT